MMNETSGSSRASIRAIAQEHPLGCAVACVAYRCGISYAHALKHFAVQENAWLRGYYCGEVVDALGRAGYQYAWEAFDANGHQSVADVPGTIIFLTPGATYPAGHYLIRTRDGWMNSWVNYPRMVPVKAGFQELDLSGISFIIFERGAVQARGLS